MGEIETADLMELVLIHREAMDVQLQFWMTTTFAIIVATFAARELLTFKYRILIAVLYLLATATFITRWYSDGQEINALFDELASRGMPYDQPTAAVRLRFLLYVLGTSAAIYFLFMTENDHARNGDT